MRKILWCGGSHLAYAKRVILSIFSDFDNVFYVTGGEKNRDWSRNGGRYIVNGTSIGGNAYEPSTYHDLADYDRVIFVGQFVQPQRYFNSAQPLSTSLLTAMLPLDDFLITIPGGIFNEPLAIFPEIAPRKCVLVCDPMPNHDSYVTQVPMKAKRFFIQRVAEFSAARSVDFFFQPAATLDEQLATQARFTRSNDDYMHMNDEFWQTYLQELYATVASETARGKN